MRLVYRDGAIRTNDENLPATNKSIGKSRAGLATLDFRFKLQQNIFNHQRLWAGGNLFPSLRQYSVISVQHTKSTSNSYFTNERMENIFWTGFSNDERHSAIYKIQSVVSKYGDVVNVQLFSDISLSMTIEIEELKIDILYNELANIIGVQKPEYLNSVSKRERTVYLNITFAKGTGNFKNEIPSVPG